MNNLAHNMDNEQFFRVELVGFIAVSHLDEGIAEGLMNCVLVLKLSVEGEK